jgi:hypothetical protein
MPASAARCSPRTSDLSTLRQRSSHTVGLDDALRILVVMAEKRDPRLERAAVRWVGRLLTETPTSLRDARFALAMVERLPECSESLHRLAVRR